MAMKRYKTVDEFLIATEPWHDELVRLREILLTTGLDETVKWAFPCYTYQGKNVVGLGGFQGYFGLWFFQGALLDDPNQRLMNAQDGRTKAMRQWRMTHRREIKVKEIKDFVKQAMHHVDAGHEIKSERKEGVTIPEELASRFRSNPKVKSSFQALTPGRQREYAEYIAEAKREETRLKRLDKIEPLILAGQGLHDKYRNC